MHSVAKHELAASGNTGKANILVVDDHEDKVLVLQTILEELNENVVVTRSGKEALKFMLEMEFAVILLDVKMPEMDGFETAALIRGRKRFAHTPIIFVTSYAEEMHTAEGYSLGAVDYVFKPFDGDHTAEFTVLPQGDATPVTWLTHGPANLMAKLEQIFVNLDNRIGKAF